MTTPPPVAWDAEGHVFTPVVMTANVPAVMQGVVNEIEQATTIAQLRDALLNYVEAVTGVSPQ
jgi:VanZ family protein